MLKNDVAHGLTVSPPNRDKLTMRSKPLSTLGLILSLSKDEATDSCFFSILLALQRGRCKPRLRAYDAHNRCHPVFLMPGPMGGPRLRTRADEAGESHPPKRGQ